MILDIPDVNLASAIHRYFNYQLEDVAETIIGSSKSPVRQLADRGSSY